MNVVVFVEPHERGEAIEAWRDRLTPEQIDEIYDANDSAIIRLDIAKGSASIMIIEEG